VSARPLRAVVRPQALAALLALFSTIVVAGCGGGDDGARDAFSPTPATSSSASSSTPPAPTETTTSAPTGTLPTTPRASTTEHGARESDTGDEEGIRVPATFRLKGGRLRPPTVSVPAFLRIELVIANQDTGRHTVTFRDKTLAVPGGDTKSTVIEEGLKKGRFPVAVDGRSAGAIVSGAGGGP
jgi:hypothetical protein